ncbi:hypothetical protein BDW74DRAFT_173097 [Aspergillus multicolor]|uniref:uncharacterized protein n=1 Tax=Aspergillus multicolor TaxID=41759 RepID=UPI003CCD9208
MPTLTALSAPNLLSAENIEIWRPAAGSTVDLSRLRSVEDNLQLAGDFSRIELTSLQNASTLTVCKKWCETTPEWDDAEAQALDVDLPSLETAGQLSIKGNILSISAPQLQTLTSAGLFLDSMSRIPVALGLPRLYSAKRWIKIAGDVANLNFPMMRNLTSYMLFKSRQPLHFKLAAETLFRVELEGRF